MARKTRRTPGIYERTGKDGATTYQAQVRMRGHPTLTKTFARKTDAAAWLEQTRADLRNGRPPQVKRDRHTLLDAIERYRRVVLPAKSASTRRVYGIYLRWWEEEYGAYFLDTITTAQIVEARERLSAGRASSTAELSLRAMRVIFSLASGEWEWLERNPMARVKRLPQPAGRVRFLSDDERVRLLEACRQSRCRALYTLAMLAIYTGMRRGELLGLTWDRVDLDGATVRLEQTKNGGRRVVPLAGPAVAVLAEWGRVRRLDTMAVFPARTQRRHLDFYEAWQKAVERAGLRDFHFHDLRHTAASYLAMSGATLLEIGLLLGHRDLASTRIYAHLTESHLASVVERMAEKYR